MDDRKIDYFIFEGEMARKERTIKKLWAALLLAIVLLFAANAMWLYAWCQYDYESYEYSQDGEGLNIIGDRNYIGPDS